jgi:hypothetical protein
VLVAIVVFKTESGVIGGDFAYEGIRSWGVKGSYLVLNRSRSERILVPSCAFTSAEIRVDKDYVEADNG